MSFIFASKYATEEAADIDDYIIKSNSIEIYCDTKVEHYNQPRACYSVEQLQFVERFGIVKSTIICPEFCISFAGNNIALASELFYELYQRRYFDREDVLRIAYNIHRSADPNQIEFIITSAENDGCIIDCIKENGIDRDVPSAHIGSSKAFEAFQKRRYIVKESNPEIKHINEVNNTAFREVVEGCKDDTVGGFPFCVRYLESEKSFCYSDKFGAFTNYKQTVGLEENIRFFVDAERGNYSYTIKPIGIESVLLDIEQMDPAILYSRLYRCNEFDCDNKQLFGLMLPMLVQEQDTDDGIKFMRV